MCSIVWQAAQDAACRDGETRDIIQWDMTHARHTRATPNTHARHTKHTHARQPARHSRPAGQAQTRHRPGTPDTLDPAFQHPAPGGQELTAHRSDS